MQETFEAIVLGLVQGATEFLPISSSGHLRIVPAFAGWEDPGAAFTAVIQLGTMAAVLLYFRKDLWSITRGFLAGLRDRGARGTLEWRMGWYLILGTVPISVIGLALADTIETEFRSLYLVAVMLIVAGLVLGWSERFRTDRAPRELEQITPRDVAVIGFAQAAALVPGVSRSGATMSAGLFLGLERTAAARFSFLLSIPAVVLSGLFELRHIGDGDGYGIGPTIAGTLLAFVSGYLAIAWLLRWITTHSFNVFVGYRLLLAGVVIALAAAGTIT
jgi:undecaprenyl-diphosphatase